MNSFTVSLVRQFSTKCSEVSVQLTNGRSLKLSSGKLAKLADGAAVCSQGDTSVMVTVVSKHSSPSPSVGMLPLTVDYRQKSAAAGRIPMNFFRRDLAPNESEILTSRLIDRSLRPMFYSSWPHETQIVCNTLAVDSYNLPDVLAVNAASLAVSLSSVPWKGPVAAVRIGFLPGDKNNELVVNPTRKELEKSKLNLIVTGAKQNLVVMLEGSAQNIMQPDLLKAIKAGVKETQHIIRGIEALQKEMGKTKMEFSENWHLSDTEVWEAVRNEGREGVRAILRNYSLDKFERDREFQQLYETVREKVSGVTPKPIDNYWLALIKEELRKCVLETDRRCDGRTIDQVRPIACEVDVFKPLHGSALFQRGQTQVLATVTLDSPDSALRLDPVSILAQGGSAAAAHEKNFFLHYQFPQFATNEIGKSSALNRREIGHGALAERGIRPVMPAPFPFTVRLSAEVLESNGSSSMASVCAGSLALMDAGVPLNEHVAGVAMGLLSGPKAGESEGGDDDYRILTDILGFEDFMGDMDFKIAGTRKGFTALQADLKIPGLSLKKVMETILRATDAKNHILDIMNKSIDTVRAERKENWPVAKKIVVDITRRSKFLGVGGENLKKLYLKTGVQVTHIEDSDYEIFAPNQTAMDEAMETINELLTVKKNVPELEFGEIIEAKIVEIRDIGVMVEIHPEMAPVLLHLSHLDTKKVAHPSALGLEIGQEIKVKYFGRDPVSGFIRLSRKVLL